MSGVCVVLPKSFEEYDDLSDFMQDAKVYLDRTDGVNAWEQTKEGSIFVLSLAE